MSKISVILPAYNSMQFLPSSVNSILSQTHTNLELIVVNDGSTDNTASYLRSVTDPRLKIINNVINVGITESLNKAVLASSGEYIARMDADDIALPQRLASQLNFLELNDFDLVSAKAHTFNKFPRRTFGAKMGAEEVAFCLFFFNPIVHPLVFAKASVFKDHQYVGDFEWAEDYFLWTQLVLSGLRMGVDDQVLLHYRIHSGQISVSKQEKQLMLSSAVQHNYFAEAANRHEHKIDSTGFSQIQKLNYVLSQLLDESKISAVVRGIVLRVFLYSNAKEFTGYGETRDIFHKICASFCISNRIVALAAVLNRRVKSDIPTRLARRVLG